MTSRSSQAGRGDEARFRGIYERHHLEILAYFRRRLPHSEIEDATAEVFTVVWRRLPEHDGDNDLAPWIYGVAHGVLRNIRRSRARTMRLSSRLRGLAKPTADSADVHVIRSTEAQMMFDAIDRLSFRDRELLRLIAWENLTYREIGRMHGISEDAVSQRASRARKRLARELDRIEKKHRTTAPQLWTQEGWE